MFALAASLGTTYIYDMQTTYQPPTPPTKKGRASVKKRLLTLSFILLNIAVILYTAISEFSDGGNASRFEDVTIRYELLLPALLCCLGALMLEVVKYLVMMKKTCGFVRVRLATESVLLGRYYDNITPFGSGGQPFQIYYLNKAGIGGAPSATLPVVGFLSMQYAFILLAIVSLFGLGHMIGSDFIRISAYVGLGFYALVPTVVLAFTFFPNVTSRILGGMLTLLAKLRILKRRDELAERLFRSISHYSTCVRSLLHSGWLVVLVMLLSVLYQMALCSIPYFVLHAFGGTTDFLTCFVTTVAIYAAITFIPTPGNAGAAETSFYQVFSSLAGGRVFWAMLVWRFFTYYIFIFFGIFTYIERWLTAKRSSASAEQAPTVDQPTADGSEAEEPTVNQPTDPAPNE